MIMSIICSHGRPDGLVGWEAAIDQPDATVAASRVLDDPLILGCAIKGTQEWIDLNARYVGS